MHNHLSHALNIINKLKQVVTIQDQRKQPNIALPSPISSLKLKGLAQARGSHSGKPSSPRRGPEKGTFGAVTHSRLGETSSPERDVLSLKTGARRLSDSSRRQDGQVTAGLA